MEPEILFEDRAVTVACKPPMMLSERGEIGESFAEVLAARNPQGYVGVIHRLDRGVGGVMLYARTPAAAAALSRDVAAHRVKKEYLAIVHGVPDEPAGRLCDLLFFDRSRNKSFAVDRKRAGVKEAVLDYRVLEEVDSADYGQLSLIAITLQTGRTHQIRVQFSARRHPLLGDGKYGARDRAPIGLACYRVSFPHPTTGKELVFSKRPEGDAWSLFSVLQAL